MAPSPSAELIAHFLRANAYTETLDAFLREAALPPSTGLAPPLTLEALLDEKRAFDLSRSFERLGTEHAATGWTDRAPRIPHVVSTGGSSNVLHVSIGSTLIATTADRRVLHFDTASWPPALADPVTHESPILSCAAIQGHKLCAGMAGQLAVAAPDGTTTHTRRDHAKYVVQVAVADPWIATAAWDGKVLLYRFDGAAALGAPVGSIALLSNPEALAFVIHPDTGRLVLVVTRRDSTFLYYYTVESEPRLLGKQNLAPHSNAWVAFTPAAIALCPTDPGLLAVATSTVPHMKLIIVRLLLPPDEEDRPVEHESTAGRARAELALQDKEDAAIVVQCSTLAPQTQYSTPALAWRPDGSGVWVNSDDGVIRGLESRTGKLIVSLKGHDAATKVRCLAAAVVGEEEWLVSGGFDQKLIIWKPEQA